MSFLACPNLERLKLDNCDDQDVESLLGKPRIQQYMQQNEAAEINDRQSVKQGYINKINKLNDKIFRLESEVSSPPPSWLMSRFPLALPFARNVAASGGRKIVNSRRRRGVGGKKIARTCRRTRRGRG